MHRGLGFGVPCAFLLLCTEFAVAQPQHLSTTPTQSPATGDASTCPVPDRQLYIVGRGSTLCVPVTAKDWTTLSLPPGVRVALPSKSVFEHDYDPATQKLHVMCKPDTPEGATASIKIVGPGYTATVWILAGTTTQPEIVVEHITEEEAARRQEEQRRLEEETGKRQELEAKLVSARRVSAEAARELAATQTELTVTRADLARTKAELAATKSKLATTENSLSAIEGRIIDLERTRTELERSLAERERKLEEASRAAHETEREMLIDAARRYTAQNQQVLTPSVSHWVDVQHGEQRLRFGKAFPVRDYIVFPVDVENPVGHPLQLTGARAIDANGKVTPLVVLDPTGLENAAKNIITTIPAGGHARLLLALQRGPDEGSVRIELTEYASLRPPIAAQFPEYIYVPLPPWTKQLTLGPSALVGACWLAESAGSPNLDSMACYTLGVRLTKGFTEAFAFEAEALGGWTAGGEMRSAKFGRATVSGVVRFGAYTVPYVRVGIGAQVASVDGSGEVGFLLSIGAGVDRRLGDNVLVGVRLAGETMLGDATLFRQAVSAGVHLSVGWGP